MAGHPDHCLTKRERERFGKFLDRELDSFVDQNVTFIEHGHKRHCADCADGFVLNRIFSRIVTTLLLDYHELSPELADSTAAKISAALREAIELADYGHMPGDVK